MESRLYLRRIMCNSMQFGGTASLTDEEKRRTIISLQGGKTFGRGSKNDVMFVDGADGSDDALKSPQYISRIHARVEHTSDDDNFEQYFLYDSSENGTYINDKKLEKNKKHTISIGESIKFGHRNGSQHVAGETYDQPNAQFAFIVEMVSNRDPLFEELGKMGATKVKVLTESAVTRVMTGDTREPSPVNGGGCPENGIPSSSSAAVPPLPAPVPVHPYNGITIPGQMPSTSRTINIPLIPKRAPHDARFDDPLTCYVLNANRYNPKYTEAVTAQSMRFQLRLPALRAVKDILGNFLDVHVAYEDMKSKQQKIAVIDNFCKTNHQKEGIQILHCQMDGLADLLIEDEKKTDELRDLLVKLSTKPKEPIPSENSAFERTYPQPGQIFRPVAIHPEHSETDYVNYLRFIAIAEAQARELARRRSEIRESELKMRIEIPISDLILNGIDIGRYRQFPYPPYPLFWGNYLSPFRQLEMCPIVAPTVSVITTAPRAAEPAEPVAPAVQDVADVAPPTPRPTPRRMDPAEVDEERHSASSGSTTENSFRQRTDSVESEIVDVVSTDDDKTAKDEEQEEKGGTETDTPTPSPEDSEANVEEDPRKSSTPRIDAQSTSSAVVSALPTPMSSPVPKVKTQKASAPEAASPEVTAPIHVETAAPATPSTSSPKIATPKAPMIASPEKEPSPDSDEPSTSSKPVDEKKIKTKSAVPSTSTSMPSTSDASKTKQKEATGPSRRMKQLDESSADSESEDDDKSKRLKKVRRSTRTAKASSPIPAKRKKVADDDMDEGSEEVQDESKATPRGNGNAVRRKTLKRANAEEQKPPRRSMKEKEKVEVETEEPPKKKRGRKKAEPVAVEDEEPVDPDKEKCGVAGTFCLCIKYEKRKNLQWVSCSDCNQWFHVWCVRLDNICYGADDKFACCGPHASPEAIECLQGDVHRKWWAMPGKRPVPQSPEPE
ncbi:hypothetical protein GCK72_004712 [Caenorhabditis remanei]|uniref:FHA domain-containing protein n=1 Tax=Caenorhabditis remanei TaxID=31234 RepID=A0A6A5HEQ8_CAERE|nr:hypothetical protein GCK72_004712 [Caenorhabditis remanei]KAF1764762.1 hypothetical protein GCK72_004712 [Caenorhabditis remanei]